MQADVWAPIRARTDIVNFSHSHDEREKFPYSKTELAHALQFLVDHPLLCKRMDKFEDCYSEGDGLEDLQRKEIELEKKFEEVLAAYDFQNLLGNKRHADSSLLEDLEGLTDLESQKKR